MGTGYTRNDTPNNIADGNVINASDLDGEFDAIQAAFNASTGHSHDGTTGEGPQITAAGIANDAVALGTKTTGNYVAAGAVSGVGLSGSASAEGATFTVTSNATDANTGSTIVARDASGNFSAGTITAALTGNAATATALQTARTIAGNSFDGTANITIASTDLSDGSSLLKNVSEDTTPQLGGNLDTNGNNITGTGDINITGTITSDGLTMGDGHTLALGDSSEFTIQHTAGGNTNLAESGSGNLNISARDFFVQDVSGSNRLKVDGNLGDISFYDSTGTTQGLFWDASTQRLGLGTTSPSRNFHLVGDGTTTPMRIDSGAGASLIDFKDAATTADFKVRVGAIGDNFVAYAGGSERMRIDSSGNVGIGEDAPSSLLHMTGASPQLRIEASSGNSQINFADTADSNIGILAYDHSVNAMTFRTNDSERVRIDASGNLLVGTTDSNPVANNVSSGVQFGDGRIRASRADRTVLEINRKTSDGSIAEFRKDGTTVGSISVTGSGTAYNTTSDIRLKTDIEPIDHATDMLMAMNPVSHRWKADPDADAVVGFIAQEMQEIVPEAVSGSADSDEMMSMDYGRITPVLVAALQDAHKKIEELEARINKMEAE